MRYLWRANVLSGSPDAARLEAPLRVDTLVPGRFDPLLYLENGGDGTVEMLMALKLRINDA